MKTILFTGRFKKDVKKYRNSPPKINALHKVIELLRNGIPLPDNMRPHKLTSDYKDCMECHIEGDYLLIWRDEVNDVISLLRLGSHSELFN